MSKSKRIALKDTKYVAINHLAEDHIEVAVVGIDGRVIQSNESYLKMAIKDMRDLHIDDVNPRKVPVPEHDPDTQYDPGWEWMGFSVYAEPQDWETSPRKLMEKAVDALKKEAKALHMKVYEAKGKWPKAPRMASQRNTTKKATDRQLLIRLASTLEKGSEERKAILAALGREARLSPKDAWYKVIYPALVKAGVSGPDAYELADDAVKLAFREAKAMFGIKAASTKKSAGLAMDEDDYFAATKAIRDAILEISEILDETYDSDLINGFYKLLRKYERSSTGHPFKLAGMAVDSDDYFKMMKEVGAFFKELDRLMDASYFDGDERDKVEKIISGLSRQYRMAASRGK